MCEIIVVDNASYDGCAEMLAEEFPSVRFLQSETNLGFGGANNFGARFANSETILFLNPDTEVKSGALKTMLTWLGNHKNAGIVGCRLLNTNGSFQASCLQCFPSLAQQFLNSDALRKLFPRSKLWGTTEFISKNPEVLAVEAVSGACMMMNLSLFQKIGGFSEYLFMYAEDVDLCYKAFKKGHTNYYVASAEVIHHGGGSSSQEKNTFSAIMKKESVRRFFVQNRGVYFGLLYRLCMALAALLRLTLLTVVSFTRIKSLQKGNAANKWGAILRWSIDPEAALRSLKP